MNFALTMVLWPPTLVSVPLTKSDFPKRAVEEKRSIQIELHGPICEEMFSSCPTSGENRAFNIPGFKPPIIIVYTKNQQREIFTQLSAAFQQKRSDSEHTLLAF